MLRLLTLLLLAQETEQQKCKSILRKYFFKRKLLKTRKSSELEVDLTKKNEFLFLTETRWGREVFFDRETRCSEVNYGLGMRLYLRKKCSSQFCALYHGFKGDHFASPSLLLTSRSQLHIQIATKSGANYAFEVKANKINQFLKF